MQTSELQDFPYSGTNRPFDWFLDEPKTEAVPTHYLTSDLVEEAWADLRICMYLYMADRKNFYVNYMAGAKNLFAIFFPPSHCLREMAPAWSEEVTKSISMRGDLRCTDWPPGYEIQRLWIATKVHWSWLELAWQECERKVWESNNSYIIKKLERVPLS